MLEFGGILFWGIFGIIFLCSIVSIEKDGETSLGWPLSFLVISVAILLFFYRADFIPMVTALTGRQILFISISYLVVGLLWSLFKWNKFIAYKAKYHFKNRRGYRIDGDEFYDMPKAKDNVDQVSTWIIFWPISALRYAIGDLLSDLFRNIVKLFSGWYDAIGKSQWEKHKPKEVVNKSGDSQQF